MTDTAATIWISSAALYNESPRKGSGKPLLLSLRHNERRFGEQLKEVHFLKPDYADTIKINITGILRKWKT